MLKSVLIICFSLLFTGLAGCISLHSKSNEWTYPIKPKFEKVDFKERDGGYFISELEAVKLADNIDEIKAYNQKLEVLIKEMIKYYE